MDQGPVEGFMRYFLGFMLFISVSFGVTLAVNAYSQHEAVAQQAAAALQSLVQGK